MFNKIILFILLASTVCVSFAQELRVKWSEISLPSHKELFLVGADSPDDVWVTDKKEVLFHWNGKQWNDFLLPDHPSVLAAEFLPDRSNGLLAAVTSKQYRTSYYRFSNGRWLQQSFVSDSRTQSMTPASDSSLYIWGDWGSLVRVRRHHWSSIPTPFKNHIVAFQEIKRGEYLVAVRTEGIFLFDGTSFTPMAIPERFRSGIRRFIMMKGKPYAVSVLQQVLEYENERWKISALPIEQIDVQYSERRFGFLRIFKNTADTAGIFIDVPRSMKVLSHYFINDTTLVLTTGTGTMRIGKKSTAGSLVDATNVYNVMSNPEYPVISLMAANVNRDDRSDLFVIQKERMVNGMAYVNNGNAPFDHDANVLQPVFTKDFLACTSADFNGDRLFDIAAARIDSDGIHIELFELDETAGMTHTVTVHADELLFAQLLTSMTAMDYDDDGDNDLLLTFYHDREMQKGFVVALKNSWWGRSFDVDTSFRGQTRGWITGISIADLLDDGHPELVVHNRWGKNMILAHQSGSWKTVHDEYLDPIRAATLRFAVFTDLDLDNDIDVIALSDSSGLHVIRNDGNKRYSSAILAGDLVHPGYFWRYSADADINNDGYPDLLMGNNDRELVLVNEKGIRFADATDHYRHREQPLYQLIVRDFDNDGDADLFGYRKTGTAFFENTTNPTSLILASIETDRLVSISLLERDSLGASTVCGYRDNFRSPDVRLFSFAVEAEKRYQLQCRLSDGTVVTHDAAPGAHIVLGGEAGVSSLLVSAAGMLFRFVIRTENQLTIAAVVFTMLIIGSGLRFGVMRFRWESNVQLWFVSGNVFLFWILSVFTSGEDFMVKYVFPLLMVLFGSSLPLLLYAVVRKKILLQASAASLQYQLLETVIEFMHGQWAVKNLNGLMLYCSDMAEMDRHEPSMVEQLNQRKAMFLDLTLPRLYSMCSLAHKTGIYSDVAAAIESRSKQIRNILHSPSLTDRSQLSSLSTAMRSLKSMINDYRDKVLKEYSCVPDAVVDQVVGTINNEFAPIRPLSFRIVPLNDSGKVLMKSFELADIIDNSIRNAIRAVPDDRQPLLSLTLYRISPKICIDIGDNGIGIPTEKQEIVFQKGYSEYRSTGLGLSLARETAERYGGRVFIKRSEPGEGTIFTIELNEVP